LTRIIYDEATLKYITLFESLSGARVKDCMPEEDKIIFIIEKGDMGLAIGKGGSTLKRIENSLRKQIKIIEFNDNPAEFVRNYVYPLRRFEIRKEDKILRIKGEDIKTKGLLIGRERANIKNVLGVCQRYFDINEIIVE
jgi:N utilization substance protein A